MRADATVAVFALVAVHTEDLEPFREAISDQPLIDIAVNAASFLASELMAVVVDVVDGQKQRFVFTAAGTLISVMSQNRHFARFIAITKLSDPTSPMRFVIHGHPEAVHRSMAISASSFPIAI